MGAHARVLAGRAVLTRRVRDPAPGSLVGRYLVLGLALGRHIEGLVDAYYGPEALVRRASAGPLADPAQLVAEARSVIGGIDAGEPLDAPGGEERLATGGAEGTSELQARRRRWLRAQVLGLLTTARRLAGERVGYEEEVEGCYGVRPRFVPEEEILAAHGLLAEALPGNGPLGERLIAWRERHAVAPDVLPAVVRSVEDELRARTERLFGLPEGEQVDVGLVTGKPWSGFNTYLGGLRSKVEVNTDLPVLSTSLGHLVAHEAYPGHHSEHCRKEVRLVRSMGFVEETAFFVGTPECLVSEGLADLGIEVAIGPRPEPVLAEIFHAHGLSYDPEVVAVVAEAGEALGSVRSNAAWRLHAEGAGVDEVTDEVARLGLLPAKRATKAVEFLVHPTWRAYVTCYTEGLALCRGFVGGDPARFERLLSEQLTPADLSG